MAEKSELEEGLLGSSGISYHHITGNASEKEGENTINFNEGNKTTNRKINWTIIALILIAVVALPMVFSTMVLLAKMSGKIQTTVDGQDLDLTILAKSGYNMTQNMEKTLTELLPGNLYRGSGINMLDTRDSAINATFNIMIQRIMSNFGWTRASNDHYYKVFLEKTNYKQARYKCLSLGGGLAAKGIRNEETRIDIFRRLIKPLNRYVWVGLDDINLEGTFFWSDGVVSNKNNTNWGKGEPNDLGRRGEDCVQLAPSSWVGFLNDGPCNRNNYFLCETTF